jgi:DNA-binding MarR family transcriptional regulator
LRQQAFEQISFGEPAWELLLSLYIVDSERRRLRTGELCKLAGLPLTTALRWLEHLRVNGLIKQLPHLFDQRATTIELSSKGRSDMDGYFQQMRDASVFGSIALGR